MFLTEILVVIAVVAVLQLRKLNMKVSEIAAAINAIDDRIDAASKSIVDEIATLKGELADVTIPQAASDSIARLSGLADGLGQIAAPTPPTPAPTPTP